MHGRLPNKALERTGGEAAHFPADVSGRRRLTRKPFGLRRTEGKK